MDTLPRDDGATAPEPVPGAVSVPTPDPTLDQTPAPVPGLVPVVITVDHVYLPLDSQGRGRADWLATETTVRVARRTRLDVPADLAAFLSERDQAEIVG